MQKLKFLSVLFLLIAGNVFSQTVTFNGNITNAKNNLPIVGANVIIEGSTYGATSNIDGNFSIEKLRAGIIYVAVSYSGFKPVYKEIVLKDGQNVYDFELEETRTIIDEVVVTGTATRNSLKYSPVQTELFTEKLIKSSNSRGFEALMLNISPSFDFSPTRMGSRMQLNGLGNDYILVLIDGKRLYGDVGGQNNLSVINPANIEKIEVVKGASSSLYGSEAIAGVVNIITKKSKNSILIENTSRFGSYGDRQQNNAVNINFGKLLSSTNYSHKQSNGWQVSELALVRDKEHKGEKILAPTTAKSVNEFSDHTINQKFLYNVNENTSISIEGVSSQKDVIQPISYKRYGFFYDNKSISVGGKYLLDKNNLITLDISADNFKYYRKYNAKYNERYTMVGGKEKQVTYYTGDKFKNSDQKRLNILLKGVIKINDFNKISLGTEYINESLESKYRLKQNTVNAYSLAAYIQDEIILFDNLYVIAGLRYSNNEAFADEITPKISSLYKLSNFNFRATYAMGYKAPSLKELYLHYESSGMGSHNLYLGNENLKAQTSDYYSVSAEYNDNLLSTSITYYLNMISDLIGYRVIETNEADAERGIIYTKENYNISDAQTSGVDFVFNSYVGAGFTLGGGYSYVDAKNITNNTNLEATARHYTNINCAWSHDWSRYNLSLNLSGRIQSEKYFDDGNAKGYDLWSLNTIHRFGKIGNFSFEASLGVNNIFNYVDNSPYGTNHGTLSSGRTFFCGVNIRFIK